MQFIFYMEDLHGLSPQSDIILDIEATLSTGLPGLKCREMENWSCKFSCDSEFFSFPRSGVGMPFGLLQQPATLVGIAGIEDIAQCCINPGAAILQFVFPHGFQQLQHFNRAHSLLLAEFFEKLLVLGRQVHEDYGFRYAGQETVVTSEAL